MSQKHMYTVVIFASPFLVAIFATIWFTRQDLHPQKNTNIGTLVNPQVQLLQNLQQPGKWQILTVIYQECASKCQQRLQIVRNVYWSLGKESHRAQDGVVLVHQANQPQKNYAPITQAVPGIRVNSLSNQTLNNFINTYQQLPKPKNLEVWLVDPLGYIILRYEPALTGNQILIDWRKLLKISKVG